MKLTTPMQITAADTDARTITGRIVAFNEHANASTGKVVFARGSIAVNDVFLNLEHDNTRRIGKSIAMSVNDKEMTATFKIANTTAGTDALVEAMDGKEIMIPNEEFIINKVTNWTYSNNRARIEIIVGVAYGSDLVKAKQIMLDCAKDHKKCLSYPEAECFLSVFDDYDIKFTLYFWINDIVDGRLGAKSDVMIDVYQKLTANNIVIPIPQREVKLVSKI